jgi:hypothetical protein
MIKKCLTLMLFCSNLYANGPIRPIQSITPGVVDSNATIEKICTTGYTKTVRNVSQKTKNEVFANYGIDPTKDKYEIDHLISLELGGSNDIKNLWPESYTTTPLNAYKKDTLENKLHDLVCADKITLEEAQRVIVEDWVKAYHDYVLQH